MKFSILINTIAVAATFAATSVMADGHLSLEGKRIGVAVVGTQHFWDREAFNGATSTVEKLGGEVVPVDGGRDNQVHADNHDVLLANKVDAVISILGDGAVEPNPYGDLAVLFEDDGLEEVMYNGGTQCVKIAHRDHGMCRTNIWIDDDSGIQIAKNIAAFTNVPLGDGPGLVPIFDGRLPDGSRVNGTIPPVTPDGPTLTIRKFREDPLTMIDLVKFGTVNSRLAAMMWVWIEGLDSRPANFVIAGGTGSGKTTTLNAILPFIDHNVKIYSAEDTPEVKVAHKIWQRLVTRSSKNEDSSVEMFDLLKAALRSRPRYIIIGEIRGVEGATAFQAMQTGHPVIATFHASSIVKMIQRFTGDPINVPIRFFDNLNFAIFQEVTETNGNLVRRITGVDEVIGYNKHSDGVLTRGMFEWDPLKDKHYFRGMFQSHLLENKIAAQAGFANKRDIYDEMLRRASALDRMVNRDLTHYDDVFGLLNVYYNSGWETFDSAVDSWVSQKDR